MRYGKFKNKIKHTYYQLILIVIVLLQNYAVFLLYITTIFLFLCVNLSLKYNQNKFIIFEFYCSYYYLILFLKTIFDNEYF